MRVLIVSRTVGPARNLAKVAAALVDGTHEVMAVLSKDPDAMVDPARLVGDFKPDVVLASTSSANLEDELSVMNEAVRHGVPIAMFADTYGAFWRKGFRVWGCADAINTLFVPDEAEKKLAEGKGFQRVVVSGVPLWEELAQSREDFDLARKVGRAKLGVDGHKLITWSPGKNGKLNKQTLLEIFAAFREMGERFCETLAFVIRFHPGDDGLKNDPNFYKEVLPGCPVRVVVDSGIFKKQEDIVPAVDLLINSSGTLGIAGIYQRRPVLEYLPKDWEDRLEEATGFRTWPPASCGASLLVSDQKNLASGILALIGEFDGPRIKMCDAQVRNYPTTKGRAVETIVHCLLELAVKKGPAKQG